MNPKVIGSYTFNHILILGISTFWVLHYWNVIKVRCYYEKEIGGIKSLYYFKHSMRLAIPNPKCNTKRIMKKNWALPKRTRKVKNDQIRRIAFNFSSHKTNGNKTVSTSSRSLIYWKYLIYQLPRPFWKDNDFPLV